MKELYAVIMAGGSGERFWPRSRTQRPKHLIDIVSERTMIQLTVDRVLKHVAPERVFIITNKSQAPLLASQVPEIPFGNIVAEPMGRDTAPCVGFAAALCACADENAMMLVLPADHVIEKEEIFWDIVKAGIGVCAKRPESLLTFGIVPHSPRTGYGYIEKADLYENAGGIEFFNVARFTEKPNLENATRYVQSGNFYWNSGIFLWSAKTIRECFKNYAPEVFDGIEKLEKIILDKGPNAPEVAAVYAAMPRISIDYAVMEKSDSVLVARSEFLWNDVGAWPSVSEYLESDEHGNASKGLLSVHESKNCTVVSDPKDNHLVALVGVDDLVVVHTHDATLVCKKDKAEEIKKLVIKLKDHEDLKRFT